MTDRRPRLVWPLLVGLAVFLLWLLRDALLPFVAAFVLAYLLHPLATRIERRGAPRGLAAALVLGAFVAVVALLLMIAAPPLARQAAGLIERLPEYAARLQAMLGEISVWLSSRAPGLGRIGLAPPPGEGPPQFGNLAGQAAGWGAAFLTSLLSGGQTVLNILSLIVVAPVVAFYLLLDWDRMIATVDGWSPRDNAAEIRQIAREIDAVIGAFLRGQALVCLFLALWYGAGLLLVGLNFGFLIGLSSGLFSFVPYLGSVLGFLVAAAIAIVQFWPDYWPIALVIAVFVTGQFLESYVITPKIVGEATGLHPVWIMFALFAFGALFGFVGLLLAVPMAAAIGVIARHAMRSYRASDLFDSERRDAAE
jgi:predicted PurR-regulated permease PerM